MVTLVTGVTMISFVTKVTQSLCGYCGYLGTMVVIVTNIAIHFMVNEDYLPHCCLLLPLIIQTCQKNFSLQTYSLLMSLQLSHVEVCLVSILTQVRAFTTQS